MGPKKTAAPQAAKKPAAKKESAPKAPAKKASKVKEAVSKKPAAKAKAVKGKESGKKAQLEKGKKKKTDGPDYGRLFEPRHKNYSVGNDIPPRNRDLTFFVKWPLYIKRQRKKRVLQKRLRIPPAINQFRYTVDRHLKKEIFRMALRYKPETVSKKRRRLRAEAVKKLKDPKTPASVPPPCLYKGAKRVYRLIEAKRAKLVLIAHDVDPLEIVMCMPALCRKQGVPYCIVKGKANLGQLVNLKTATCIAFVNLKPADKPEFEKLCTSIKVAYNDRYDAFAKKWGGLKLSMRAKHKLAKKKKIARGKK